MIYFFLTIVSLCSSLNAETIENILEKIPCEERQKLDGLFYGLINHDHFGYSLFGDKPVALSGHTTITHWENFIHSHTTEGTFWKYWDIWEKYLSQIPIKNFLLQKEPSPFCKGDLIILINKQALLKTVQAHSEIFETILGHKIQPEQFLKDIELNKKTFMESINHNVTLLGILLGYGKHNSILFAQKRKIFKNSCLQGYGENCPYSLLRISSLNFMADLKHAETQQLHKKYSKMRNKLSSIYSQGSFFKSTLAKLIAE